MQAIIKPVHDKAALKAFVRFPFQLYKNHPCWIPPLLRAEMATFDPAKNPALQHSRHQLLTAWKDGRLVGRIAVLLNDLETAHLGGQRHARFGWVDFVDDPQVSEALFIAAEKWARDHQCICLKGPYGFNQLDKNGMLTEGFDSLGTANTIYNYEYYPRHLERLGYQKDLEWVEQELKMTKTLPERLDKASQLVQERYHLRAYQPKNRNDMLRLGQQLFELLMATYHQLPGFVPISDAQRDHYIKNYISFLRLDFISIAFDENDTPVSFAVTMPSLSKALRKANGRLFPFGLLHLLKARRRNDTADLSLIGVREEWRKRGAHSLVFADIGRAYIQMGIHRVQINPMLEFNVHVLQLWKDFEHHIYKRRRTYRKEI